MLTGGQVVVGKGQVYLRQVGRQWVVSPGQRQALTVEHLEDFADMAGLEFLLIDEKTVLREFKKELRWNEIYYHLANGLSNS